MPTRNEPHDAELCQKLSPRFWSYVERGAGDACWPWKRYTNRVGYGEFRVGKRKCPAHRFAWIVTNGPIPDDTFVCHRCDNPPCCNPAHLFLGTAAENMLDKQRKGRAPHDESSWNTKLTDEQVDALRADYYAGGISQRAIGEKYGISRTHAGYIIRGRSRSTIRPHKHVPLPSGTNTRGALNPRAKLSADDVRSIRAAYSTGLVTLVELGEQYGVSHGSISGLVRRKTWRSVA